ncbi:hypothetical protein H257_11578 [Aphanomyces astaci]|uniref:Uncharacterized protein n=1 Tax=Aphanomyces astaci TaxID=112090 RepID=W4G2C2_APHAT|nr:hypothetical protein H257_11578 [Aphanomyces astaci]ETV73436.1 hypothetical protein H257_11578 [Aphanomyces astaci]KAF0760362.1 hypothetical protein AaE_003574 [Aphanomyces astaci]RHY03895.1 hypothetical protein DYB36_005441 [Aphanomyces astaci]RHY10371.1 hypothetical protein DYB25_005225 [Aphanomyces astaci]RHY49289.1 hypothetical protein DYB34_003219 [Aphanomyces astaci]|eukprot:XP_009836862.1 hypothetical protein H257_11578 [Aphanomyces astaci]
MKRREKSFDTNTHNQKLPEYNALADHNLRHFFENRKLQHHLYDVGMIDKAGRVIDPDKHKGKLAILQQEFKHAEKAELLRQREEDEIRRRVQLRRHAALNEARKEEKIKKIKDDRMLTKQIVAAAKEYATPPPPSSSKSTSSSSGPRSCLSSGERSSSASDNNF